MPSWLYKSSNEGRKQREYNKHFNGLNRKSNANMGAKDIFKASILSESN